MKDFKELKVWTKAHEMTMGVYQQTRCFPKEELYGLTSQTSTLGGVDRREHCRRMWPKVRWRVHSLPANRKGLGK